MAKPSPTSTRRGSLDTITDTDTEAISTILEPINTAPLPSKSNVTAGNNNLTKSTSRLSRVASLQLVRSTTNPKAIIPRAERRGILGKSRIVVIPEIQNPYEYTNGVKFMITFIVGMAGSAAPMGSAIMFPSLPEIEKVFNKPATVANLTVALYMGSMAICPLYWSRFSERSGRRTVYILSFLLFFLFSLAAALTPTPHIWFLVLMRMGVGGSAGAVQSVGAGTISDIWEVHHRGKAMGWFYLGPLMGPLIAPLIGGGLASRWGWRSTQWFLTIFGAVLFFGIITSLPETLKRGPPPVKAERLEEEKGKGEVDLEDRGGLDGEVDGQKTLANNSPNSTRQDLGGKEVGGEKSGSLEKGSLEEKKKPLWRRVVYEIVVPFYSLSYLRYPPVTLTIGYATFAFMCVYVLNTSMQSTFSNAPYNYSPGTVGLFYIAPALGNFTGSIVGGRWTDRIMKRRALIRQRKGKGNGELIPEDRMRENAWVGGLVFPLSLLCYGWTVKRYTYWLVPVFPTMAFGFGSMLLFGMCTTMLTEFVPGKSSSVVAVQNFIRNIFACIGGVITAPLLDSVGEHILFTIMCGIGLAGLSVPWIMKTYGPRWRENVGRYNLK